MNDAQGGSSLRMIYVLFLCLFLGSVILGFFYDRIADHLIWKSQIWLTLKIPTIVFSIIAILTILVTRNSRSSKKQENAEKEFAQSQGWIYTESYSDPQGLTEELKARLEKVCSEKEFNILNNMTVETGRRNIILFSCWYRVRIGVPRVALDPPA